MKELIFSLIPLFLFYLIYSRYFLFRPEVVKHAEAFIAGIFAALVILAVSSYISLPLAAEHPVLTALIKAAIPEKLAAAAAIIIIFRHYPNFSLMEGTISAMIFGLGFAIVENLAYSMHFGISSIIIRLLFSLPIHMTTCGIMGYYIAFTRLSSTRLNKTTNVLKAAALPLIIHWFFDSTILLKGQASYMAAPIVIISVIILEYLLAKSQVTTPRAVLKAMQLRFEDWLSIFRQPKYERWILYSMGIPGNESLPLLQWRPGVTRLIMVIGLITAAMAGLSFRPEIMNFLNISLHPNEQIILLGVYPSSICIILILVGAINPNFLKAGKIKIPVIADADVYIEGLFTESLVTYDITTANAFLRTSEPMGIGRKLEIEFQFYSYKSPKITGSIVWENHQLYGEDNPTGSIISIESGTRRDFMIFLARYYIFRLTRGLAFNLKLPGSLVLRKYFMRPHTTMQSVKLYQPGEIIFKEGDPGSEFYLLKKGKITFFKTKESGELITMDTISDGELFGEMAILGNNSRAATAKCLTECVVAVSDIDNLNALIYSNPDFASNLIKKLIERVQTSEKILFENIRELENQKNNTEKFYHAALLLTLIGMGYDSEEDNINLVIDTDKISRVIKNIDDSSIASIINIIKMRSKPDRDALMDEKIQKTINSLNEKYRIEIRQ